MIDLALSQEQGAHYTGVRVPDRLRLGEVHQGWPTLMVALQDEHSPFTPHLHRRVDAVERWASSEDRLGDDDIRLRLARAATAAEVGSLLDARTTWLESEQRVPVAEGPMAKLFGTEAFVSQRRPRRAGGTRRPPEPGRRDGARGGQIFYNPLLAIGTAIYAGTSEIQRNIIAQHACGLPRS